MSFHEIHAPLNHELTPSLQRIEVASSLQIPSFHIVGLPSQEISEAKERVRAAIESSGFEFPKRKIVLNLSPAHIRKKGTGLDLAMALAVLTSSEKRRSSPIRLVAWGELGLDGTLKSVGQVLRAIYAAWQAKMGFLILPTSDQDEAQEKFRVLKSSRHFQAEPPFLVFAANLSEALKFREAQAGRAKEWGDSHSESCAENSEVSSSGLLPLSPSLERVLGTAVTGRHHLLLVGPRGAGKSHALNWFERLQPEASPEIRIRQALIAELHTAKSEIPTTVPIRRIGCHVRPAALIGTATAGGLRPGEFSLAHGGALIVDEFPEWSRDAREALREPMESKTTTLTRALGSMVLPADFQLAANGNLCPCGGIPPQFPVPGASKYSQALLNRLRCRCTQKARADYAQRLSGPVLDRVDIALPLLGPPQKCAAKASRLNELIEQIQGARELLRKSWSDLPGSLSGTQLESIIESNKSFETELRIQHDRGSTSSLRARHKVMRVALSLAAWEGLSAPEARHFTEASLYRAEAFLWDAGN